MVSTATTLASNRRKFRLAQHHGPSAAAAQAQNRAQSHVSTAVTSAVVGPPSSAIASSKMLSSGTTTLPTAVTHPQRIQQQQQQQQQLPSPPSCSQAPVPPSTNNGRVPFTPNSAGNTNNNTAITRGRSRRSRAATRRGVGGAGRGGREGAGSRVPMEERDHEDDHEDIFSSLSSIDITSIKEENNIGIGGHQYCRSIHRASPPQRPGDEVDHNGPPLNLHVVESVDSDDSGTCFNSIGTNTPRQPSPRHGANHYSTSNINPHPENIHAFSPEQRQPDTDQPDFNRTSRQRLLPTAAKNQRMNRSTSTVDNMHLNSSDTLSSLHEHVSAAADSSTSSPSSFRSRGGNTTQEQDEFALNQSLPKRNKDNRSIWDRTEEMVSSHSKNSRSLGNDVNETTTRSRYKPSDNGSAYSEFDWDGVSSHHVVGDVGGGGGWDNYNAQHASRQGPPSAQGSASVEYSRYDVDQDVQTFNSVVGSRGGGDTSMYKRSVRQSTGALSNNGGGVENGRCDAPDDSNIDDAIFNRTNMKATIGVCAAATLGGAILGPIGILVGAASIGIGMGVMQIPEEQRNNVRNHAAISLEKMRNFAFDVSDTMSTNCAKYSGVEPSELVGMVVPNDVLDHCGCLPAYPVDGEDRADKSNYHHGRAGAMVGSVADDGHSLTGTDTNFEVRSEGSSPIAHAVNGMERGMNRLVGEVFGDEHNHLSPTPQPNLVNGVGGMGSAGGRSVVGNAEGHGGLGASGDEDVAGQRVACGRKGRVVPLSQIHSLRPSLQPRAWLDVMASAYTTRDDKNEAMQEILILAKDKDISRWFLEEGILDSLMFILSSYFRNYSSFLRLENPIKTSASDKEEPFSSFKQGGNAFNHAKLAANCCVALGKAYCAAVHTEGDLLLMSAYSRGSVPVERQLAQMLFEVPHHMKVMNPSAGSDTGEPHQKFDSEFTLTELSMQQAEDLASSIKALDDGKIDV